MHDRPDAADLLATARETVKSAILPHLPRGARYPALMALNAMAIAARQAEAGAMRRAAARAALAPFATGDTLDAVAADLARSIRAGRFAPGDPALHAALLAAARLATEESNPKARILAAGAA
jgi:hypothetical protein